MAIIDRLSRLIRANVNDLISQAEDPRKIIEQSLSDMRDAYYQARKEVAAAMAQAEKLKREQALNAAEAQQYADKAQQALKAGSEDLAREALRRKKNYEDLANGFAAQLQTQQATIDELKTQLRALEAKISEMDAKKDLLQARQETAKASKTLDRASGFDRAGGAMQAFESMERKVSGMEDEAKAMTQLRQEGDLDSQLHDLGRDQEVDAELEQMKRDLANK
jgi:phage shock protein A